LERHVATERDILEAETKLAESRITLSRARQRLQNLGLTDIEIHEVARRRDTSSLLAMTSPFAGIVVERTAVMGEVVNTSKVLFAIGDTSKMWAMLDVYEADFRKVRLRQPVVLTVEGLRGEAFGGRITWISSHVDRRTKTLKVRAEIANPEGLLRAGMFGKAVITIHDKESLLVVPKAAVQWDGCCNIVFVKHSDTLFKPRKVQLGYETDAFYTVEGGLKPHEVVVTTGSFLLKTEILKGSIGAGCCEVEPGK
jgi:cobalt-zinc-cadmium efflux system membrane fusion protein